MTNYKELKKQAKNLTEITRSNIMELRAELGLFENTTLEDCSKIMQELNPLTKKQRELFECFNNDWLYCGSSQHRSTNHKSLLALVKKGYLRTRNNDSKFKRIIPLTETEVE